MKKIFFLFFFASNICIAQTEIGTAFQNERNTLFQYLDRIPVTTGLLKEYGMRFTDVSKLNGTLTTSNYCSRGVWSSLYTSLYFMKFNNNVNLTNPEVVNATIDNYNATDGTVINLMALHYQYEQFKTNAATSNLVYLSNNQIFDTPNRPTTPYEVKDAVGFAAAKQTADGGNQTFVLRSDLFLKNVTKTITALQIDFGNGAGFQNVTLGTTVNVTYPSSGEKALILKITYADGQVVQSQTKLWLTNVIPPFARYSSPLIEFFPKNTNFPVPTNQMGTGIVSVATAGNDGILDKPLILVEGFDPENTFGYFRYQDQSALGVDIGNGQTLSQALEGNGFDLVFLNFGNGSDDIKRNAYLLENVIQWVNQQTAAAGSTQKNIVVGVSMGGLVSRYALRDMEVRNVNHNTRLYASIDSPHQGANIPLGFQAAIRFMGGLKFLGISLAGANPELQRGIKALNSPAATQMITYQLSGQGDAITLNNTPYLNFMTEYRNMGLPRQWGIRTLAVASGSECGITQGFAPNSVMLSGNGSQDLNYFLAIYTSFIVDGPIGFFESFFSTDTELKADLSVRALPNQEVKPIFNTRIRYTKEVLFGLYNTSTDLINFTFNSTANLLPLDSNPGGKFDVNSFATIPTNISFINLNLTQSVFSFIPTTSSLDVGGGTQSITNTDYLRAYSPTAPPAAPKNIPFNNFFSNPLANENHVQLTKQNGNWLLQEALGTPAFYSCSYQCAGTDILPSINFPSLACANSTPLSINNYANGSSVSWTSSTAGLTISPNSVNNTTATRVNNFSGQVTISASVTGACGNANIPPRTIWVGNPPANNSTLIWTGIRGVNPVSLNAGSLNYYQVDNVATATSYSWSLPRGFTAYGSSTTTTGPQISVNTTNQVGTYLMLCRANNTCGSSWTNSLTINVVGGGGGGGIQMRVAYPNPVSDSFTVKLKEEDSREPAEVSLFNKSMERVFFARTEEREIAISTLALLPGTYYLNIVIGKDIKQQQIVVNH